MPGLLTIKSRMRRMNDWYTLPLHKFVAIGRTAPWEDEYNPPKPAETTNEVTQLIGLQLVDWEKFAKVIENPTTLQKKEGIYYKGLYYEVTEDYDYAMEHGFTSIMLKCTLDRDKLEFEIPVDVTYRQIGLYVMVNSTALGITAKQWNNMSESDKGILEVIDNRSPIVRQDDQEEELYFLLDF